MPSCNRKYKIFSKKCQKKTSNFSTERQNWELNFFWKKAKMATLVFTKKQEEIYFHYIFACPTFLGLKVKYFSSTFHIVYVV